METRIKLFLVSAVSVLIGGYIYEKATILSFTANLGLMADLGLLFALAGCMGLGYFMAMPNEKKE